ncbi:hypothetical protein SAZ10_32485 [Mesorhizobium sp. BAC0120]|uniref:hypothetical protein n=1 Tax=Mesorhizobium sp. BAC0120 TaxID=3090670 RepID=UPI00298C4C36|nr:hypothetical protein [Mesorhizobium sp. BAC0120]MDW6026489.1 hypothetical protein [Mesorhizobium sp. BAC0120]
MLLSRTLVTRSASGAWRSYMEGATLTTPSPLWGGIQGGGLKRAKPSRRCYLLQQVLQGNRWGTPTLYPSPQGGGGHRRCARCDYPAIGRHKTNSVLGVATLLLLVTSTDALAHASDRGYVLLLPIGHYIVGGAAAVAASFLALVFLPAGSLGRFAAARLALIRLPSAARSYVSVVSFGILLVLIAAGFFGSRDPLSNPLPLTIWTLLWVGLTLVQGLVGDIWQWINPWLGPYRLARSLGWPLHLLRYPERAGYWPALVLFAGFAWFELIDIAPDEPGRLASAVTVYTVFTLAMILVFGYRAWTRHGEFLSVFFGMIARFAVLQGRPSPDGSDEQLLLGVPGARVAAALPLPPSGVFFLLFALASVSFDGLSRTFFWLGLIGVNPLEFPGRSAVIGVNSFGLLAAFLALAAVFFLAVSLGERLTESRRPLEQAAGLYVWSIVPIALAYHLAHYLTVLLVNGQYGVVALSDPFSRGWNLFGTADMAVGAGIVSGSAAAWVLWNTQAAAIIAGHVLAVLVAHVFAGRLHPKGRDAMLSQLPLTLLMIAYTVFGLWLLSTPTAG